MQKAVALQRTSGGWLSFKRKAAPYVFIAPFFITFMIFQVYPIFYTLYLSFFQWGGNAAAEMVPVGFGNYINIIKDPLFWQSLLNTLGIAVITAFPQHILALFFAFILNQGLVRLKDFFKGILFLPYITSAVAVSLVFLILYGYRYGLLNFGLAQLEKLGIIGAGALFPIELPINWFRGFICWFTIATVAIWRWTGWNAIIYFAGLQAIPDTLYEAARIDGANWSQVFFRITLPLLRPIIFFATTMTIIGQMQLFDDPMVLIGGVPGMGTFSNMGMTLAVYLYGNAFAWSSFGKAGGMSYIILILIVAFSVVNNRIFRKEQ